MLTPALTQEVIKMKYPVLVLLVTACLGSAAFGDTPAPAPKPAAPAPAAKPAAKPGAAMPALADCVTNGKSGVIHLKTCPSIQGSKNTKPSTQDDFDKVGKGTKFCPSCIKAKVGK